MYKRQLWQRRVAETHASAEILGAQRVEFLGYIDSGMMGTPANEAPGSFWTAPVDEAAKKLAVLLDEERADVLTCYDEHGGYGHPDHIQVHRVGLVAAELAGTRRVYQSTINRDHILRSRARFAELADEADIEAPDIDEETFGMPESVITTAVDVTPYLKYKRRAMRAHASQISEQSFFLAMPDEAFAYGFGTEWFIRDGQGQEERLLADLAGVRPHGTALVLQVRGHVHRRGDDRLGYAEVVVVDVGGLEVSLGGRVGEQFPAAQDVVAVDRGLKHAPGAGQLGGPQAHPVHLDVVRVAVPAVLVVAGQDLSALLVQDRGELLRSLVHRGGPKRPRHLVGRGAHHAGVGVPEEFHPLRAKYLRRRVRLDDPPLPEFLAGVQKALGDLALLAARGHDEHDPVPFLGGFANSPAAGDAFVVRVGMKRHESGHARDAT